MFFSLSTLVLGLSSASAAPDAGVAVPVVPCAFETAAMSHDGDAADDPAVWVNRANPERSLIIGTDKKRGLMVYDLSGAPVQELPDGRMNNVDVVQGVRAPGGGTVDLVFASNRDKDTIAAYQIASDGRLSALPGGPFAARITGVYGLCADLDPADGTARVVVNNKHGQVMIVRFLPGKNGFWRVAPIGSRQLGSQVEGCVIDTARGWLYVGEEAVGLWRFALDAKAEPHRVLVDTVRGPNGGTLAPDVEGVTLYQRPGEPGYLLVSCQGEDRYAVFDADTNRALGSFRLSLTRPDGSLEPVTHTDGITVVSEPVGPRFPRGMLVVQDDNGGVGQNFKVVDWRDIERVLTK